MWKWTNWRVLWRWTRSHPRLDWKLRIKFTSTFFCWAFPWEELCLTRISISGYLWCRRCWRWEGNEFHSVHLQQSSILMNAMSLPCPVPLKFGHWLSNSMNQLKRKLKTTPTVDPIKVQTQLENTNFGSIFYLVCNTNQNHVSFFLMQHSNALDI